MKCLTWSQVARAPPYPSRPKKVAEEPAYLFVSLKTSTEAPIADFGHTTSLEMWVNRVVSIAPSYRKTAVGQMVTAPVKPFKDKDVVIPTNPN